jgi:putative transposase
MRARNRHKGHFDTRKCGIAKKTYYHYKKLEHPSVYTFKYPGLHPKFDKSMHRGVSLERHPQGITCAVTAAMIYRSSFRKKRVYFHLAAKISDYRLSQKRLDGLWVDLAKRIQRHQYLKPHCCVLMSNHFHAIFEVPEICFEMAEAALRAEFTQVQDSSLNTKAIDSVCFFRISCFAAFREVFRYIYRNPIEAGICVQAQLYPYSSLGELIGLRKSLYCVSDSMGVITNPFSILNWINSSEPSCGITYSSLSELNL